MFPEMKNKIRLLNGDVVAVSFGTVTNVPPRGKYKKPYAEVITTGSEEVVRLSMNLPGRFIQSGAEHPELVDRFLTRFPKNDDDVFFIAEDGWVVCWGSKRFYDEAAAQVAKAMSGNGDGASVEWSPGTAPAEPVDLKPITSEEADDLLAKMTPGAGKSNHNRTANPNAGRRALRPGDLKPGQVLITAGKR